jgi:hypothetical protein
VEGQAAGLGPQSRFPGLLVGLVGSILRAPAMTGYFSAHRRASATQTLGNGPHRTAAGDAAGNVFAFSQRERQLGATTCTRRNPAVTRQQEMDDLFILAECSTNRI